MSTSWNFPNYLFQNDQTNVNTRREQLYARRLTMLENLIQSYNTNVQHIIRLIESADQEFMQSSRQPHTTTTTSGSRNNGRRYDTASTPATNLFQRRSDTTTAPQPQPWRTNPVQLYRNIRQTFFYDLLQPEQDGFTAEQINQITQVIHYDPATMTDTQCPIMLTNYEDGQELLQIRACSHSFSPEALTQWFSNHNICPICRRNPMAATENQSDASGNNMSENIVSPDMQTQINRMTEELLQELIDYVQQQ